MKAHKSCWKTLFLIAGVLFFSSNGALSKNFKKKLKVQKTVDVPIDTNPVEVPIGRTVTLDPEIHLKVKLKHSEKCTVAVLSSPFNDIIGSLSHKSFPCKFKKGVVTYTHFGGSSPLKDYINLQVRLDTHTETKIIPSKIVFDIIFVKRELVKNSLFLTVDKLFGHSEPIGTNQLNFNYDPLTQNCTVATLIGIGGFPQYGVLTNDISMGSMVSCDEMIKAETVYKHMAGENSANIDKIQMKVEVKDKVDGAVKSEYFQVEYLLFIFLK